MSALFVAFEGVYSHTQTQITHIHTHAHIHKKEMYYGRRINALFFSMGAHTKKQDIYSATVIYSIVSHTATSLSPESQIIFNIDISPDLIGGSQRGLLRC